MVTVLLRLNAISKLAVVPQNSCFAFLPYTFLYSYLWSATRAHTYSCQVLAAPHAHGHPHSNTQNAQALALLANLLMKDYVKWRGALFHRFALALVDSSPAVRNLAEYLLGDTLATKVAMQHI
jgi:hypothetical protein